MVVIRLARTGAKSAPFYHVVVADSRKARGGRFIERLGFYNPMARGPEITLKIDRERIEHWITRGAQPSDRIAHLLKSGDSLNATKPKIAEAKSAQMAASHKAAAKKAKEAADEAAKAEKSADETPAE